MNRTELMAFEWLKKNKGYKDSDILRKSNDSPDFICLDGKRYEVKFLYANKIIFYSTQIKKMKDDDNILVFDRNGLIIDFLWKNRNKISFNIQIIEVDESKMKVELDTDIVNELIKRKKVRDTYSDIIRELLRKKNG